MHMYEYIDMHRSMYIFGYMDTELHNLDDFFVGQQNDACHDLKTEAAALQRGGLCQSFLAWGPGVVCGRLKFVASVRFDPHHTVII